MDADAGREAGDEEHARGIEKLREAVRKAAEGPAGSLLSLTYRRGHDLAGLVTFEAHGDGTFRLSHSGGRQDQHRSLEGRLLPGQFAELAAAVETSGVLDTEGSTRPLGDDEIPILVLVKAGDLAHRVLVWQGDVVNHPGFARLDAIIREVIRQLEGTATPR